MARLEDFPLTEPGVIRGKRPDPRGGVWIVRDTVKVRRKHKRRRRKC